MRRPGSIVTRSFSAATVRLSPRTSAPPPVITTSRPTPEFRQHHDVEAPQVDATAFRQGWQVHSRLAALAANGMIDREQMEAAASWGRWAERTSAPGTSPWRIRVDGGAIGGDGLTGRTLAATTRLRASAAALGAARCALLYACVVEDQSWRRIGRRLGVAGETAQDRVVEAIAALALWLAGEPVPPAPEVRFRNQPSKW